jgi:hypothetical protein
MIRSSRDAGCHDEAREYERNIADDYAALLSECLQLRATVALLLQKEQSK